MGKRSGRGPRACVSDKPRARGSAACLRAAGGVCVAGLICCVSCVFLRCCFLAAGGDLRDPRYRVPADSSPVSLPGPPLTGALCVFPGGAHGLLARFSALPAAAAHVSVSLCP